MSVSSPYRQAGVESDRGRGSQPARQQRAGREGVVNGKLHFECTNRLSVCVYVVPSLWGGIAVNL